MTRNFPGGAPSTGVSVGTGLPGSRRVISASASRGACIRIRRESRTWMTPSRRRNSSSAISPRSSAGSSRRPASTASLSITTVSPALTSRSSWRGGSNR